MLCALAAPSFVLVLPTALRMFTSFICAFFYASARIIEIEFCDDPQVHVAGCELVHEPEA